METPYLPARLELRATESFREGLLLRLLAGLRQTAPAGLLALVGSEELEADLSAWSKLTGNAIVGRTSAGDGLTRWVIRNGPPAAPSRAPSVAAPPMTLGARLWIYTNFDCNLSCDYCCVRSSPRAPRRELGLDRVRQIAAELGPLGVREVFVTGGEPLLLDDIADIVECLSRAAPTTLLTNAALVKGERLAALSGLDRARVAFQISLDSPDSSLHDLHRGRGTWERALRGADALIAAGFRVRLAATLSTEEEERRMHEFLDARGVPMDDRVVRRMALRGLASDGVALARADIVPEITITAEGVFWHPVGAEDSDLLVTREIFPLADAFAAVARALAEEQSHGETLASVFHCA